jgi:hypothetical protein
VLRRYDWRTENKGGYTITVRGIDKAGKVQELGNLFARSYPNGAKGYNSVKVKVYENEIYYDHTEITLDEM